MSSRKIVLVAVVLALSIIIVNSYLTMTEFEPSESYNVSVIVSDSNNDRWEAFKQGANEAALENGIKINYVHTSKLQDPSTEMRLIKREIASGVDGVIVQMCDDADGFEESLNIGNTNIVYVESDVYPEGTHSLVTADNYSIGKAIAEAMILDFGKNKKLGICVLAENLQKPAIAERYRGFLETIADTNYEIYWLLSGKEEYIIERLSHLSFKEGRVDALVALGNEETELMIDNVLVMPDEERSSIFYGVGSSEKSLYFLDSGAIDTLVVPIEYSMGYESMKLMIDKLKYNTDQVSTVEIDYLVVNKDNLYDEKNQKILFPVVQ